MLTLSFDDKQMNIPQSWADIRLSDYEGWFRSEPKNRMDQVKFVANICAIDVDVLLNNPTGLYDVITDSLGFVFDDYQGQTANCIAIGDTTYAIAIANELTLAEWVDVESVFESESETRLSDILSVICRPLGELYDSKKSDGRKLLFRNLSMDKVLPLLAFFLQQKQKFQTASNLSLQVKQQLNQYLELTRSFVESGDGTKSLPIWQRIKFYFLMKSLKKQLSKCSDFYSIDSIKITPKKSKTSF